MIKLTRRGAIGKYLLLVLMLGLLVGWFAWTQYQGVTGHVKPFPNSTAGLIAFVRSEGNQASLYTVSADGTGLSQMSEGSASLSSPAWAPDGSSICYVAEPSKSAAEGRAVQLFIKGAGTDTRQLTSGSTSKGSPQWQPGGKLIAFLTGGVIKVIKPNGSDLVQVYPPPHKSTSQDQAGGQAADDDELKRPPIDSFSWAPNGIGILARQIVEGIEAGTGSTRWWEKDSSSAIRRESTVIEPESLVLLPNLDNSKPLFMPATPANQLSFAWFPDSLKIAAAATGQKGVNRIIVCHADDPQGPANVRLEGIGYTVAAQNVVVSPDGSQLAFELWRMESSENRSLLGIAVIASEGPTISVNSPANISLVPLKVKGDARNPQWSPDGKKLLYTATGSAGTRDIWVVNADGSNPLNLTKGAGDNFDAVWSPASK